MSREYLQTECKGLITREDYTEAAIRNFEDSPDKQTASELACLIVDQLPVSNDSFLLLSRYFTEKEAGALFSVAFEASCFAYNPQLTRDGRPLSFSETDEMKAYSREFLILILLGKADALSFKEEDRLTELYQALTEIVAQQREAEEMAECQIKL
ncbi:MAG: hypothetical protein ABIB61_00615 [Candidatus Shapirobacteria bacterium]